MDIYKNSHIILYEVGSFTSHWNTLNLADTQQCIHRHIPMN